MKSDAPDRVPLLHDRLAGRYEASRREPYNGGAAGQWFYGYWSSEAAAITRTLDIDDVLYRDLPFYPRPGGEWQALIRRPWPSPLKTPKEVEAVERRFKPVPSIMPGSLEPRK